MQVFTTDVYAKFAITDIFQSKYDEKTNKFELKLKVKGNDVIYCYHNVRLYGVVTELINGGFQLDDGTGSIKVLFDSDYILGSPEIGDFVMIIGKPVHDFPVYILSKFHNVKKDPMEEVRFILEQCLIHTNYDFVYENLFNDPYCKDGMSIKMINAVLDYFRANPDKYIDIDEINTLTKSESMSEKILRHLRSERAIYIEEGKYKYL